MHVAALRAAGFAEIGTIWQRGENRLFCAVIPAVSRARRGLDRLWIHDQVDYSTITRKPTLKVSSMRIQGRVVMACPGGAAGPG